MVEQASLPTGTKPEGATSEQEASRKVREMFTRIAPRYDLLNHLLSAQMDKRWRARTSRELRPILDRADAIALDLCCGTGDLAFALARDAKARIVGADFSHAMLVRAYEKNALQRTEKRYIPFLEADAHGREWSCGLTSGRWFRHHRFHGDGVLQLPSGGSSSDAGDAAGWSVR